MAATLFVMLILLSVNSAGSDMASVVSNLEPKSGPPGTVVKVHGVALGSNKIEQVYLTDHRFNLMVKVLEQNDTSIVFRVPPFAKVGRYQLLFLAQHAGSPALLEQPAYLIIEEGAPAPDPSPALAKVEAAAPPEPPAPAKPRLPAPSTVTLAPVSATPPVLAAAPEPARTSPPDAVPAQELNALDITPVEILKRNAVTYPAMAKQFHVSGAVSLRLIVDPNGAVQTVEVLDGNPILVEAAKASLRGWKFRPATLRSKPIAGSLDVTVRFSGQ